MKSDMEHKKGLFCILRLHLNKGMIWPRGRAYDNNIECFIASLSPGLLKHLSRKIRSRRVWGQIKKLQ